MNELPAGLGEPVGHHHAGMIGKLLSNAAQLD
jgi:hypothetical protein